MAEISAVYTLAGLTFNASSGDTYFISAITGLDGPAIRSTVDDAPQTDGGLVHTSFLGARHVTVEGVLVVRSAVTESGVVAARNALEDALLSALESILNADGTLAWTPTGGSGKTLTVRYEVPCQFSGGWQKSFTFGLVAADPTIS